MKLLERTRRLSHHPIGRRRPRSRTLLELWILSFVFQKVVSIKFCSCRNLIASGSPRSCQNDPWQFTKYVKLNRDLISLLSRRFHPVINLSAVPDDRGQLQVSLVKDNSWFWSLQRRVERTIGSRISRCTGSGLTLCYVAVHIIFLDLFRCSKMTIYFTDCKDAPRLSSCCTSRHTQKRWGLSILLPALLGLAWAISFSCADYPSLISCLLKLPLRMWMSTSYESRRPRDRTRPAWLGEASIMVFLAGEYTFHLY